MEKNTLENLAKTLVDVLPQSLRSVRDDVETNFKSILKGRLVSMELVTREEFDVQQEVLRKTREKLEQLEARLVEIDAAVSMHSEN